MATLEFGTYSFTDVQIALNGPGGAFDVKSAGMAAEGITIANVSEKDVMTIGANGNGMHTLIQSDAARVEISMLKTAPGNNILSYMYGFGKSSSANWGKLQMTVKNPVTGDSIELLGGAFAKMADMAFRSEASLVVWPFLFIVRNDVLGNGGNPRALVLTNA